MRDDKKQLFTPKRQTSSPQGTVDMRHVAGICLFFATLIVLLILFIPAKIAF